jgi:hypothetical protein
MIEAFVGALAAAGIGCWLLIRRSRARNNARHKSKAGPAGGRFAGVHIRPRGGACGAARALEGRRFLSKDAPSLPLPECTASQCSCSFAKLADRRSEGRRLQQGGLTASLFIATNRRTRRDRRRPAPPPRG